LRQEGLLVPVIFVTAFRKGLRDVRQVTESCGLAAFLSKPVSTGTLLAQVERVLGAPAVAAGT
jgi:FixJ family two-component response regulator